MIWEHPEGISSDEIYACFSQARGTKSALLHRISEKGYVEAVRQGKSYLYRPKVNRLEYQQAVLNQEMKKSMGIQSFHHLVAAFCGKEKLTNEQSKRVEEFLKELEDE